MKEKLLGRDSLRNLFEDGSRPNGSNFASLIDSMINKVDDGIARNLQDGLILSPEGNESDRLISFYDKIHDNFPEWSFQLESEHGNGLNIVEPSDKKDEDTRLFFSKGGNIGVHTLSPRTTLEVQGTLGVQQRIGTYKLGQVPADGKWHDIITNLDGCNAFEVVAQVGKKNSGKYAMLHANALSTFGRSWGKIRKAQAHYGWIWNRINLRWRGKTHDYKLQMKTCSNYGDGVLVNFHIAQQWGSDIEKLFKADGSAE